MQQFFVEHQAEIQFAAVFGGMLLLLLVESSIPRRAISASQAGRRFSNIGLALLNHFLLAALAVVITSSTIVLWLQPQTPLLHRWALPFMAKIALSVLALEFATYWIHRALHRIPLLWRIHAVHHADTEMDVTTSHRHHPFEAVLVALLTLPVTLLLGAPLVALLIYIHLRIAISLFSHANILLPRWLDGVLRLVIVTPDFHRLHHASEQRFTDSNYGTITPWFDYLFGSASHLPFEQQKDIELGLRALRLPEDNHMDRLLALPFTYDSGRA